MGSLKIGFSLSSNSVLSSPVNVVASSSVIADSGVLVRAKVFKTTIHLDALVVYKADLMLVSAYLYVKNLEKEKENYVYVYNHTDSTALVAKIAGGEFCFIPVAVDKTYKVHGTRVDSLIDYAVFGLDSSAETLS
jgi:hypothetical protein